MARNFASAAAAVEAALHKKKLGVTVQLGAEGSDWIIINWPTSMTATPAQKAASIEAARAALPDAYKTYKLAIT